MQNKDKTKLETEAGTLAFTGQAIKEAFLMETMKEKSESQSQESAITGERTSCQKVGVMDELHGSGT